MKVLLVSSFHYHGDGVSTHTFRLAESLRRHGHEAAFFAMQDERNIPDPNSDLFVSNINYIELNRRKTLGGAFRVASRVIYSTEARKKFSILLDRFQPDVIHLQSYFHFISPSIVLEGQRRGIPCASTLHDFKMVCPNTSFFNDRLGRVCEACGKGRYYMPLFVRCKKGSLAASAMAVAEAYTHKIMRVRDRIDAYISPSRFLISKCVEHGFPADKLTHIPLGLGDDAFSDDVELGDYVLFFGRVDPLKGVRNLLDACRMVPDVKLKLAGRIAASMTDEIPSSLPPNAEYVGLMHGEELRSLIGGSLAVVVPSIWFENQPFSILEALAAGKPVIASDLGGMTELLGEGGRGLLVKPGDVRALAEALRSLWSDRERARAMGVAGLDYARSEHRDEVCYERTLRVYESVIERHR